MRALLEEAIRAQTMAEVKVLPWSPRRGGAAGDRVSVDEHLDRADIASEIAGVVVRLSQRGRRDARVVLGGFRRPMPQPGLELEERHGLFGVVQLAGDRGPSAMAGDASARIFEWNTRLAAKQRNQGLVEVRRPEQTAAPGEQHRGALTRLAIDKQRLWLPLQLPSRKGLADHGIDRFGVAATGLMGGYVKQARRALITLTIGRNASSWRAVRPLPADAPDAQAHKLIAAQGEQPRDGG